MHHHHKLIIFLVFGILLISHELTSLCAADEENVQQKMKKKSDHKTESYSAIQILQDSYTAFRRSVNTQWQIFKYLINQLEMQFAPPNLDFRSGNVADSGETIKTAAKKSFHASKEAAEETAKCAGKAMGEAAQVTAEKMKESTTNYQRHHSHDEL